MTNKPRFFQVSAGNAADVLAEKFLNSSMKERNSPIAMQAMSYTHFRAALGVQDVPQGTENPMESYQ